MKTVEEITGLEKPILEDYLAYQKNCPEDDMYDAYVDDLDTYAYNLERFIERKEGKEEDYMNLLYSDLKDLRHFNNRAIDLYCDIYLMLEETLGVNFDKSNKNIYDALRELWHDCLRRQEHIINTMQNLINIKFKNSKSIKEWLKEE